MANKLLILILSIFLQSTTAEYCTPSQSCWPSDEEIDAFRQDLSDRSSVLTRDMGALFQEENHMNNPREKRQPALIVLANGTNDVQKTVLFALKFNIKMTPYSSGHSYIGRSANDDGIIINLSEMKQATVYTNDYEVSPDTGAYVVAQPGVTNYQLHETAHEHGLLAAGGSGPTVTMGGFLMGGGHSPNTRTLGLGADNLLGATLVTADGSIVTANASMLTKVDKDGNVDVTDDTDLFYAIRGGGGVFGIATEYILQLQPERDGYTSMYCNFYIISKDGKENYLKDVLTVYFEEVLLSLPPEWGGYILMHTAPKYSTEYGEFKQGAATFLMLHNGKASEEAKKVFVPLADMEEKYRPHQCFFADYESFWDYQKSASDILDVPIYLDGRFSQPEFFTRTFAEDFAKLFVDIALRGEDYVSVGCTMIHLGGAANTTNVNHSDTPVGTQFRDALWHTTCAANWWEEPEAEERSVRFMNEEWRPMMKKHGRGSYYNEPSRIVEDIAEEFWDETKYEKLLEIKKKWDPDNRFTCWQCVGYSKDGANAAAPLLSLMMSLLILLKL